jgi:RNA polymerase sigma-70 factor (ECF subfamily)
LQLRQRGAFIRRLIGHGNTVGELTVEQRSSEKALIQRLLAGEQEACVELVREYHAPIYRLLFHLCGDRHRAEDLVQETFASAWVGLSSFSGGSSLATWLYRIAYRKFLDARRKSTSMRVVHDVADDRADDETMDPVMRVVANEDASRLYDAIARLPDDERTVIVLHHLQGMKYEQITEMTGVPAGTLRWRKSQALESLRRLLQVKLEYEID